MRRDRSSSSSALAIATAAGVGATAAAALWVAGRYVSYWRNIRRAKGLPQVRQFLSYFSLLQALLPAKYNRDFYEQSVALFAEMDTPLFAFAAAGYLGVHINEAHLFREVCVTKRRAFPKATDLYDVLRVFGPNVVTTEGEVWKRHRAVASRAFSDANNRLVFETTLRCTAEMVAAWERQASVEAAEEAARVLGGEPGEEIGEEAGAATTPGMGTPSFPDHLEVEVLEDVTQMALAIITAAAFGFPIHASYGPERHAQTHTRGGDSVVKQQGEEGEKKGGKGKRYELSFTRCMEVVSQRTLAKVLLPGWALRLPFWGLREVGVAFREFNDHLLDVVDRERALQREERHRRLSSSGSSQHRRLPSAAHWRDIGGEDLLGSSESGTEKEKERPQTLFRLLVQANNEQEEGEGTEGGDGVVVARGRRLDMAELLGNAFIFLLAGHETSSHALTFALMLLAVHRDELAALQHEVDTLLGTRYSLEYEDLEKLVLCHGAMNEALRLFPPVVIIPKVAAQDGVEIASAEGRRFAVPKGAVVALNVYALHRNPKHYPEPEAFKPRRWDPHAPGYTPVEHFAFAPFSLGERSCIGRKFGQIMVLASLATLIHNFDVSVPPGTDTTTFLEPKQMLTLAPAHGSRLIFTRRARRRVG